MLRKPIRSPAQEVPMRTLTPFPPSAPARPQSHSWNEPTEFTPAPSQPVRKHRDEDLMYAWSLQDPTQAAQVVAPARQREECPPEVYIG
jgi:hypothetical protein